MVVARVSVSRACSKQLCTSLIMSPIFSDNGVYDLTWREWDCWASVCKELVVTCRNDFCPSNIALSSWHAAVLTWWTGSIRTILQTWNKVWFRHLYPNNTNTYTYRGLLRPLRQNAWPVRDKFRWAASYNRLKASKCVQSHFPRTETICVWITSWILRVRAILHFMKVWWCVQCRDWR